MNPAAHSFSKSASSDAGPISLLGARPVRRIIRHRFTLEYFGRSGWTTDPAEACTFEDILEAARACSRNDLRDVELVLQPELAGTDLFKTAIR